MTTTTVSANRLRDLIHEQHGNQAMIYIDQFALGCYLHQHMDGVKKVAGKKLINEVLSSLPSEGLLTYKLSIRDNLAGNESKFAKEIEAHMEVNQLFVGY